MPGGAKAGDQAVEVLARGDHRDELAGLGAGQLDELPLDIGLRAQAVRGARGTQRGAFDQQPVDAVQALVAEHVRKAKAGAAVSPQVAGVEQAAAVGVYIIARGTERSPRQGHSQREQWPSRPSASALRRSTGGSSRATPW